MPSVTSLDSDMRNLRLSRYTPQAANEARAWIEDTLGRSLPPGDLLDALKDGTALCELANMALPPPGIRFKKSQMPFIQMENISHFLKACEMPPGKVRGSAPIMIFGNPTSNGRALSSRSIWSSVRVMDRAAMLPSRYCVLEPPRRGMQRRYFWRAQARATVHMYQLLTGIMPKRQRVETRRT